MKVTIRNITTRIGNVLIDKGWQSRWAENFVRSEDSQTLIKTTLKTLANSYTQKEIRKFLKGLKKK